MNTMNIEIHDKFEFLIIIIVRNIQWNHWYVGVMKRTTRNLFAIGMGALLIVMAVLFFRSLFSNGLIHHDLPKHNKMALMSSELEMYSMLHNSSLFPSRLPIPVFLLSFWICLHCASWITESLSWVREDFATDMRHWPHRCPYQTSRWLGALDRLDRIKSYSSYDTFGFVAWFFHKHACFIDDS